MNALELRRRTLGKGVYKKTVEGNPAIAQGSLARRYLGITMQGWTEQAQYEGNQLFDYTKSEEGVLNAEGNIETGESYRTSDFIPLDSEKKYIISATGSKRGKYYNSEKKPIRTGGFSDFNPEKGTQIIPNETIAYCRFTYMKESESTIMLNEGSTLKPYEPYTGGQPSPNPDYPQEIVSAGKYDEGTGKWKYEVKLTGANLFNPDGERVSGLYMGTPLHNKSSVCMQLYEKDPDVDVTGCYIGLSVSGISAEGGLGWALSNGNLNNSGLMVITSMDVYVTWYPVGETILQKIINRYDVMVNIGEQPLPYQPYKEQTVTLTSDRPLTKWDKLEKRNGAWGWTYKNAEVVFDGSEDWEIYPYYGNSFIINDPTFENRYESSFCDKYRNVNTVWTKEGIYNAYSDHPNNARKYFKPPSAEVQTVEQWKTWLSENPLTLWYETAEETFVPLSESEQEQINELYTFRPTTVLSNDCKCEMTLTYKTKKSLEVTT